jgi:hypothetical protein
LQEKPWQAELRVFGSGAAAHLAGELFKTMAGVDLVQCPTKARSPPSPT